MEGSTGTDSRGASRDLTSAGAGGRNRPAATAAPFQPHTDAAHRASSRCAIDGEARRTAHLERAELRSACDDRFRGRLLERSDRRSTLRPSRAVARPARDLLGLLVDGRLLVRFGLRPFGWRTNVRAGMEVMSRQDDHTSRRRARPSVLNTSLRAGPGPIVRRSHQRQRAATASSARFRIPCCGIPNTKGK
jgi:hypothetical protein